MKLFEIPDAIRAALNDPEVIDRDTGEVLQPEVLATLDAEKERIVLYLARFVMEQIAEGQAVAEQASAKILQERICSLGDTSKPP